MGLCTEQRRKKREEESAWCIALTSGHPFPSVSENSPNIGPQIHTILPFLNTYSPCMHTQTDQKATAGCKRSPGVKSMGVKAKVINYGMWGDGGADKLPERKNRKEQNGFYPSPLHRPFVFLS